MASKKNAIRWSDKSFPIQGPNHTFSGDGHDKLMDFAKDTFPLAVYGMQDVFSGYLVYLKVWMSNSNPKLIGRWYLDHLNKSKGKYFSIWCDKQQFSYFIWHEKCSIIISHIFHWDYSLVVFKALCYWLSVGNVKIPYIIENPCSDVSLIKNNNI